MDIQIEGRAMNYIEQGIKVGDRVWTIQLGEVTVVDIKLESTYPIFTDHGMASYTPDGRLAASDKHPSLFWSDPHIVSPPKPEPPMYQWIFRRKGCTQWDLTARRYSELQDLLAFAPYLSLETHEFKQLDP